MAPHVVKITAYILHSTINTHRCTTPVYRSQFPLNKTFQFHLYFFVILSQMDVTADRVARIPSDRNTKNIRKT